MKIGGSAANRIVLYRMVITEAIRYYRFIILVLPKLDLLLVKPDVETAIAFLEIIYIKIVYQHIRKDGSQ